jgi:hypothetical protein
MNYNKKICDGIRDKIAKNEATKFSMTNSSSNESVAFDCHSDSNWKLDIYKTIYDYLVNCVIDKYFIFYIDSSLTGDSDSRFGNRSFPNTKFKLASSLFNLSSAWSNEQYKCIYTARCYKFLPTSILN